MFGDRPVVADYSLTRSGSNKLIIDLACGTPTFKDYQTFGQQFKGSAPSFKSMFGVDIIPYLDERPNYDQNDVFGLGAIMYYMYFKKPLIGYDDFIKEYSNLQKRMQTLVDSSTNEEERNILICVQKCVQYKLADRFKNASEILTCDLFKDRVMSQPIPAKMVANYIPTKNWCQEMVGNFKGMLRYNRVTRIVNEWIYQLISTKVDNKHLLVYTVFTSLFYRLLEKIKTTSEAQLYGSAALYLANYAITELPIEFSTLSDNSDGAFSEDQLEELVPELAVDLKGVLRIPTVYDLTDNALEIVWWLNKVCTDCTYLEKSPQQCHDEYAQLETSDSKLLNFRIQKDLVKSVTAGQASKTNYWNILYFKSYDEYFGKQPLTTLKIKFDTNGAVEDIIRL
jgi:hypothetical protein